MRCCTYWTKLQGIFNSVRRLWRTSKWRTRKVHSIVSQCRFNFFLFRLCYVIVCTIYSHSYVTASFHVNKKCFRIEAWFCKICCTNMATILVAIVCKFYLLLLLKRVFNYLHNQFLMENVQKTKHQIYYFFLLCCEITNFTTIAPTKLILWLLYV